MRVLLLAAALLYSVIAEFEGEKSYRSTSNVETQSWPKKLLLLPWDDIDHNILPSTILVNRSGIDPTDLSPIQLKDLQDLRKVTRYRSSIVEKQPIVIIMYEYQESIDDRFVSGRIRRENQGWTVQEPFYVEEPSWIAIEDNGKSLGKISKENDPFFVARGKKLLSVKENQNAKGTRYYKIVRSQRYSPDTNNNVGNGMKILEKGSEGSWNPEMNFLVGEFQENDKYPDFVESILKDLKKTLYQENSKDSQDDLAAKNLEGRSISSKISLTKTDTKEEYPRRPAGRLQEEEVTNVMQKERRKRSVNSKRRIAKDSKDLFDDKKMDFQKRTKYKLDNEELRDSIRKAILEQGHRADFKDLSFLQPRNKHSNILDIFDEPFFISRGKKKIQNYPQIRRNIPGQDLSIEDTVNGRVTEEFSPSTSNYEYLLKIFENWNFFQDPRDKRSKAKPRRNRRGKLDEILTRYDPFYVARGKRILSRSWRTGIFEKPEKRTITGGVKFLEGDRDNWSNARDLQAWKELQQVSSIMKDNMLKDNNIKNNDNLNNSPQDDANNIEI